MMDMLTMQLDIQHQLTGMHLIKFTNKNALALQLDAIQQESLVITLGVILQVEHGMQLCHQNPQQI